jgi:NADH-quinone oxidoreductase subunit M
VNLLHLPWLEVSITLALIGSLIVSRFQNPNRAYACGLAFTGAVFACTVLAWLSFYLGVPPSVLSPTEGEKGLLWSVQAEVFGRQILVMDELNSPLVPVVALLHFLTALATARTKMRRFSLSWSLASLADRLAIFSCKEPWVLIALLVAGTVPGYVELVNRGRPTRVYVLHMGLFILLLVGGWAAVEATGHARSPWATVPLLLAILVRCGMVPVHCWLTDWFEHASFGNALLFAAPLTGVYAAVRLVLPVAPDWMLHTLGFVSLATAVYASGMAIVQGEARRFFAYIFLSHASLVLVGLELNTPGSLTGALCLWFSVIVSLGGFGLTLRALEARFGRLTLGAYHGLYEHAPTLAVCFLLTALASVGFPGTLGFVSTDLLVDGAVAANPYLGLAVIAAAALNGIAVLRAYFLLFTGARHTATVSLRIGIRERLAVLSLAAVILGGGLCPQPGVADRHAAADAIRKNRMALRRLDAHKAAEETSEKSDHVIQHVLARP